MKIFYNLSVMIAETDDYDYFDAEIERDFEVENENFNDLNEGDIKKLIIDHAKQFLNKYFAYKITSIDFYVKSLNENKNEKLIKGNVVFDITQTFETIDFDEHDHEIRIDFDTELDIDEIVSGVFERVGISKKDIYNYVVDSFTFDAERPQNTYGFDIDSEIDEVIEFLLTFELKEKYDIDCNSIYVINSISYDLWVDNEVEIEI